MSKEVQIKTEMMWIYYKFAANCKTSLTLSEEEMANERHSQDIRGKKYREYTNIRETME
jgi:hypothetical protein